MKGEKFGVWSCPFSTASGKTKSEVQIEFENIFPH
jgi:hypothetical protein